MVRVGVDVGREKNYARVFKENGMLLQKLQLRRALRMPMNMDEKGASK